MPRRLRYQVAVSLDGFIADPHGEYDWIVPDPAVDFAALHREFDTAVMGRKTYDAVTAHGGDGAMPGLDVVVFSRTLPPATRPGVWITREDPREVVAALKAKPGRDIWLFGGGALFRSLLDAGLVDTVEVAVVPVLLGAGIPLLPPGASTKLVLSDQKTLPSGIVALSYSVPGGAGPAPRIAYVKDTAGVEPRDRSLLDAVLDSWDRSNEILVNLIRLIPDGAFETRAAESSPSIAELLTHIHYVRLVFVSEDAPEFAAKVPAKEWADERDPARLAQMLNESAKVVRDAVKGRIEAGRGTDQHYDHPILLLQHMIWHEGYHHGQIKLALKIVGRPIANRDGGPATWRVWMDKT